MATTDTLAPISSSAWTERTARHLLNRAAFGIPRERVRVLAGMSPEEAVDAFLEFPSGYRAEKPSFLLEALTWRERKERVKGLDQEARRRLFQARRREQREAIARLRAWWFERMLHGPYPLQEKLALFWHGHFATSAQKVSDSHDTWQLNNIFREYAAGNAKRLTIAVGQSPMMLKYLDNHRNQKGKPNENWARELMELFTLGIGHYTEEDIKEAARAFTGWTYDGPAFKYNIYRHDDGPKRFLGRSGPLDGWDVVDAIFEQPECARFFASKAWTFFASETPPRETIDGLAATLRAYDYDLKPMLRQLFLSRAFYAEAVMSTQVKSPVQLAIELTHDLGLEPAPYITLAQAARAMGQDLFFPPDVSGWEGNSAWVNANAMMLRYNLPVALATADAERQQQRLMSDASMTMMSGSAPKMAETAEAPSMRGKRIEEAMEKGAGEVRAMLQQLPMHERREMAQQLRDAAPPERRAMVQDLRFRMGRAEGFDVRTMLDGLAFATAGESADALAKRHLSVPLSPAQRQTLAEALGAAGPSSPLRPETIGRRDLEAAMHLLFSMAEYQLC